MIQVVNLHDIFRKVQKSWYLHKKFKNFRQNLFNSSVWFFLSMTQGLQIRYCQLFDIVWGFFYYVSALACLLSTFQWPCQYLVTTWPTVMTLEIRVYIKSIFSLKILSIWLSRGKNRENNFVSIVWYGNQSL